MRDIAEDNKDLSPSEPEFNKKLIVFYGLITGLVAYLVFSFLLSIVPKTVYILYSCAIGLGIGSAISYGINKKEYISRQILFILIILSALIAFFTFIAINMCPSMHTLYLHLGESLCNSIKWHAFYNCLAFLLTGLFIFYGQNNYINRKYLFKLSALCSLMTFLTYNLSAHIYYEFIDIEHNWFYKNLLWPGLIPILLYYFLLAFGIRTAIFYRMKQNKYINKKNIVLLICLSSFLTYLFFSFFLYAGNIVFDPDRETGFFGFLRYVSNISSYKPFTLYGE